MTTTIPYVCRNATTFTAAGAFDAEAFRPYLRRFVEPEIGVYVASSGSGIGQALSWETLGEIYRIAVDECRGKIPVGANIPEQYTAQLALEHAQLAVACGVDIVNIYGPDGRHGFRPTDAEYLAFFDFILAEVRHPISLCPLPVLGYTPRPAVIAAICDKFFQVENVILTGIFDDLYFINLRDALHRDVDLYSTVPGSMNTLAMGATGLAGNEANAVPKTIRRYLELYRAGALSEAADIYRQLRVFNQFCDQWPGGSPRWTLMFLKIFGLPGGSGTLPSPFLGYGADEEERFAAGLLAMGIAEIDDLARAVGR